MKWTTESLDVMAETRGMWNDAAQSALGVKELKCVL